MFIQLFKTVTILSIFLFPSESVKYFKSQPAFIDPTNWESQKPPCEADKVVFPSNFDSVIRIPTGINLNGIILPRNGGVVLSENSEYSLLDQARNETACQNKDRFARLIRPKPLYWFDPENWKQFDSPSSVAIPDIERIPCGNEIVQFQNKGDMSVDLEDVTNLKIRSLEMSGGEYELSASQLERFFKTELGQTMFKNAENTKVEEGPSTCGCHGPNEAVEYGYRVCSHGVKSCKIPKCLSPIVPFGHCCALCGAVLKLHVIDCSKFDANQFKTAVRNALAQKKLTNKVHSYSGLVQSGSQKYYQLVVIDVKDYSGVSVKFVKEFEKVSSQKSYGQFKEDIIYSGKSYSPGVGPSFWTFVISTLFAVVAFFIVIYVYFVKEKSLIPLPRWLSTNRYRVFHSPFVFARFENHPADVEVRGNIVVAVGYDNQGPKEGSSTGTTSFNNPMFCEQEIKSEEYGRDGSAQEDEGEKLVEVDLGSDSSRSSSK